MCAPCGMPPADGVVAMSFPPRPQAGDGERVITGHEEVIEEVQCTMAVTVNCPSTETTE